VTTPAHWLVPHVEHLYEVYLKERARRKPDDEQLHENGRPRRKIERVGGEPEQNGAARR
jgi:hypothetical protein